MKESVKQKFTFAKCKLLVNYKLFGSLLFQFHIVPNNAIPTFATDGKSIYYNEAFAESLTKEEMTGVFLHELLHNFLKHFLRFSENYRRKKDLKILNMALDYAINSIIKFELCPTDNSLKLPWEDLPKGEGLCLDEKFKGWNAEKILKYLLEEKKNNKKQSDQRLENYKPFDDHESSSDKTEEQIKEAKKKGKSIGDMMNDMDQKIWKTLSSFSSKDRGTIPAELQRMLDDYLENLKGKVNWRHFIKSQIQAIGRGQYTTQRYNKRYLQRGIYFPGQIGHKAKVALSLDTSGSITQDDEIEFLGEVKGMLDLYPQLEVLIYGCDAEIHGKAKLQGKSQFKERELKQILIGGGGTSHFPIFEDLAKNKERDLKLLFCFTDGYSDINEIPNELRGNWKTFWVLAEKNKDVHLDWGTKIIIHK
jgi:predicted metal-dependent peptidase